MRGRGTSENPASRFDRLHYEAEAGEGELPTPTVYLRDPSRQVLTRNDSPDIGFEWSVNPYRGCEHGCVYCYARPTHEYLGWSAGLDFESKILVKTDAPALLRSALGRPHYHPSPIAFSGITDCYQPAERHFKITRGCLEVLCECLNPVWIITKNALVTRDLDLLCRLNKHRACAVIVSLTSLDDTLCGQMEPRTSRPRARLSAIEQLASQGIPVGINLAPLIPGLNEPEVPALLRAGFDAGARFASYTLVRLPYGVKDLFGDWLEKHYPDRKQKVLSHIKSLRGGKLNDPEFGSRMRGQGPYAEQLNQLFHITARKTGFGPAPTLSVSAFRRPEQGQLALF